ncbi:MAG TPA: class I SAM-dependent methyltransferase [Kofleriaceae bacterium]|nr:class I SAM-dependent methyltransferase [Kofleriaceae bacterium]
MIDVDWTPCPCGASDARVVIDTKTEFERRYRILECARCRLRRPDVDPTRQQLDAQYDGYGDYADPTWLERELVRRKRTAERMVRKLDRILAPSPVSGRFLDVGCASGAFLWNLSRLSQLDCYGVEIDGRSAELAASLLPGRVVHGQLADARFPADHFVAAYVEQVIEHVPDTVGLLRELWRVLQPGGVLLLGTPNFRGLAAQVLGTRWKEFSPSEHVRMFSVPSLRWFLVDQGFEDVAVTAGGIWLVRRDRRDLFPFRQDRLITRLLARGLATMRLGDGLSAVARKPRGGALRR